MQPLENEIWLMRTFWSYHTSFYIRLTAVRLPVVSHAISRVYHVCTCMNARAQKEKTHTNTRAYVHKDTLQANLQKKSLYLQAIIILTISYLRTAKRIISCLSGKNRKMSFFIKHVISRFLYLFSNALFHSYTLSKKKRKSWAHILTAYSDDYHE